MIAHDLWLPPSGLALVRAAVLDGDAARAAFADWLRLRATADVAALPQSERRLLPLVAARLPELDDPALAHGRAARAETAARVGRLVDTVGEAAAALGAAGIAVMALKGIPLLLEHYRDLGVRPMHDADLLVRAGDRPRALERLARAGWRPATPPPAQLARYTCAFDLVDGAGGKLDLHQYLTEHGSTPEAEAGMWARAHRLDARWLAPGSTDLFLMVCLGALKAGRFRNSRWIPDAMRLIGAVDWELLVAEARRRRAELPLRDGLAWLAAHVAAPVPASALAALWRVPATAGRRLRYRALTRHPRGPAQLAADYWTLYSFGAAAAGERRGPLRFARFAAALVEQRRALRRRPAPPAGAAAPPRGASAG